jgi:excisionase family DNA binding protein
MKPIDEEEFLTGPQLAEKLQLKPGTIRALVHRDEMPIPIYRFRSSVRFAKSDLEEYLRSLAQHPTSFNKHTQGEI